ncbi:unnamed protein product [Sphagnum troendelagicum]
MANDCFDQKLLADPKQKDKSANVVEKDNDSDAPSSDEGVIEVALAEFDSCIDSSQNWYPDSGASHHVTGFAQNLTKVKPNAGGKGMWESLGGEASILPNDIIQKEGDLESTPVADRQPSTLELASIANLIDPKPPPDVADRQPSTSTPQDPAPQVIRYPTRERRPSSRFRDYHVFVVEDEEIIINEELKTYVEAM